MTVPVHEFVGREWAVALCREKLAAAKSSVLVIGQPGSGKTTLAREMRERLSTSPVEDRVVVLHECHANDDATLLPWQLINRLIAALSAHSSSYAMAVAEALRLSLNISADVSVETAIQSQVSGVVINSVEAGTESARSVFTRLVRAPLEALERPPTVLILVDGLDEAHSPGLAGEFGNLVRHAITSLAGSALDIRFWLSCRTTEHTEFAGVASAVVDLDTAEPVAGQDILAYCDARLGHTAAGPLARDIAAKSNGNYLYAKYVIALTQGVDPIRRVVDLPPGLDEVYAEFLRRRVAHDLTSSGWRTRYRPFLAFLAVAREPGVTVDDLVRILRLPDTVVGDTLEDLGEFLYLDPRRRTWSLFHDSFRNFLQTMPVLRISATEAHRQAAECFLAAGPGGAPDYLLRNFAFHLHGAGMDAELCAYVSSPERWREHERHAGASLAMRTSALTTARESALRLNDPASMASLLLRDLELRAGDDGPPADPASGLDTDVLVHIADYDINVMWQLVATCQAVESGNHSVVRNRLEWMRNRCQQRLDHLWQFRAAGLLAHLLVAVGVDGAAGWLAHRLLNDDGAAHLRRFLLERGAARTSRHAPEVRDSERYRYGMSRFAIDLAEKRRDAGAAAVMARHIVATPADRFWTRPNVWEDIAFGAALAWLPRRHGGDLTGLLMRTRGVPVLHANLLAALGRPEVAADAPLRRQARRLLAKARRDCPPGTPRWWLDYYTAVILRRDGDLPAARTRLRELCARLPPLDSPPDGDHFVNDVHLDAVHGPCLQGLVFMMALESATARDFGLSERLTADLLCFGANDGASALVHLITELVRAGEPGPVVDRLYGRLTAMLAEHLDPLEAGLQRFCVAVALRDLVGSSSSYTEQAGQGLVELAVVLQREVTTAPRDGDDASTRALAAALAYAFDTAGDHPARDDAVSLAAPPDAAWSAPAGRYLGLVDSAVPAAAALDSVRHRFARQSYAEEVRDFLADRDADAGVRTLTDQFGLESSLPVWAMRVRAEAAAGEVEYAIELCHTNQPIMSVVLSLNVRSVLRAAGHPEPAALTDMVNERLREVESDVSNRHDALDLAWLLARAGAAEEAFATQYSAIGAYDESVDAWRMMSLSFGGDPYFRDGHDIDNALEFDRNVATGILDAERELAVALVEGGHVSLARDVIRRIAGFRVSTLDRDDLPWTVDAATDFARSSIGALAAAEAGIDADLQAIINVGRDPADVAAHVARRLAESTARQPPREARVRTAMRLAANAIGDHDAAMFTLAHLLITVPAAVEVAPSRRWLVVLRGGDGHRSEPR